MWDNVLVNGDDMPFKCDKSFYPIFLQTALEAGFKISAGKNYLSPDCCLINSQAYRRVGGRMTRFGYLNQSLITGVDVKSGESSATPDMIGREISEMVRLCPWAACSIPATMARWNKDSHGRFFRPNWYLPVHLGGYGVDIKYSPSAWSVTKTQREVAARFVADPSLSLYRTIGRRDNPFRKFLAATLKFRLDNNPRPLRDYETESGSDPWLERLAYANRATGRQDHDISVLARRLGRQFRLKPMSFEGLARYWSARLVAVPGPVCPPMGRIRLE